MAIAATPEKSDRAFRTISEAAAIIGVAQQTERGVCRAAIGHDPIEVLVSLCTQAGHQPWQHRPSIQGSSQDAYLRLLHYQLVANGRPSAVSYTALPLVPKRLVSVLNALCQVRRTAYLTAPAGEVTAFKTSSISPQPGTGQRTELCRRGIWRYMRLPRGNNNYWERTLSCGQ